MEPAIYDAYDVSTQHNITNTVRMTGLEFDYKQALTFLPRWGRGVQVFAHASAVRVQGDAASNFTSFVPRVYNWGVSLNRERYNLRANWNYRGKSRGGVETGRSVEPGTFGYTSKIMNLELQGEYRLRKTSRSTSRPATFWRSPRTRRPMDPAPRSMLACATATTSARRGLSA